jgi:2-keto-4-pentenoate hydratase
MSTIEIDLIQHTADRLLAARESRRPIAPVRAGLPPGDIDAAYAVQQLNVERLERLGRRRVGRKIGLTSKAVQQQLGVSQPDFGVLFDFMDFAGGPIRVSGLIAPRIEAELAFQVGLDIDRRGLTPVELGARVESVCAAAEIVDSAIERWDVDIVDTVADNASCGGFVLGLWQPYAAGLDLSARGMRLTRNGVEISVGVGAATLGDPLNALAWLADVAIARGDPLRAGEIVLAGALGPMKPLEPGDYAVEIEGFPRLLMRAEP